VADNDGQPHFGGGEMVMAHDKSGADICEACAAECKKFDADACQTCAGACRACAEQCGAMATA
jgi:hypothetical protein